MTHKTNTGHERYLEACLSQTIKNNRRYSIGDCLNYADLMNVDFDAILSGLTDSIKLNTRPLSAAAVRNETATDLYLCLFAIFRNFGTGTSLEAGLTCPLLWIDLKRTSDDDTEWNIDRSRLRLNIRLLSELSGLPPMHPRLNRLSKQLHDGCLNQKDRIWLRRQLEALVPSTNWRSLTEPLRYAQSISDHLRAADTEARCYPSVFLKTQRLSLREEGMISELKETLDKATGSDTLSALLSTESIESKPCLLNIKSPTSMTDEQSGIFAALNRKNFVTVSGGTGTGKSLMLAACAAGAAAAGKKTLVVAASTSGRDRLSEQIHILCRGAIPTLRSCGGGELGLLNKLMQDTLAAIERDGLTTSGTNHSSEPKVESDDKMWQIALAAACGHGKSIRATFRSIFTNLNGQRKMPLQSLFQAKGVREAKLADRRHAVLRRVYTERCQIETSAHNASLQKFLGAKRLGENQHSDLKIPLELWSCYLAVCPIWIVDLESINRLLPFRNDLFDLVVIDEATHIDMTRPIPALYRAKVACIAADPNDIGQHTDLSQADESLFAASKTRFPSAVLSFRERSFWDLAIRANNGSPDVTLSESYRCIETARLEPNENQCNDEDLSTELIERAANQITWHFDDQGHWSEGINIYEANKLLETVKAIHEKTRSQPSPPTIGILAPLQSQVRYLKRRAQDILPLFAYEQHQLLIGSPNSFRGLERDLLFCSIGVTADAHIQSVRQLDEFSLWNLVLSRAISGVHLFTSLKASSLPPKHLLHRLIHTAHHNPRSTAVPEDVVQQLLIKGFRTDFDQRFRGLYVDFIVEREGLKCGAYWLNQSSVRPFEILSRNLVHARHCAIPIFLFEAEQINDEMASTLTVFEAWFSQHALLAWG